jgi:hypothetical protein
MLLMEQESTRDDAGTSGDTAEDAGTSSAESAEVPARDTGGSGWVTTDVAGAALRRSPRRVREYIRRGLLVAKTEGEGVSKRWLVSIDSLNALLDETEDARGTRSNARNSSARRPRSKQGVARAADDAVVGADELLASVQELEYRLGRAEARAEVTEEAESTLREERERLLADLERERERAERLEEELRRARRGWLRRFFGI